MWYVYGIYVLGLLFYKHVYGMHVLCFNSHLYHTTSWIVCDPDPDHPLEGDIAQELVEKPDDYAEKAFKHAQE